MTNETLYTWAQLEAAACMWEYALTQLHKRTKPDPRVNRPNPWDDFREAYGLVDLRLAVIEHAPQLIEAYEAALKNEYAKDFDRDFVPQYMEDHVTRILT